MHKIKQYITFVRTCGAWLSQEKGLLSLFFLLSIVAILTEGISITLLVPILQSQTGESLFKGIPILQDILGLFDGMSPAEKLSKVALVLGGVLLLRGVVLYFVEYFAGSIPLRIQRRIFSQGYKALLGVDYGYFTKTGVGDHINTLTNWGYQVTGLLFSFISVIYNLVLLLVYLVLMLSLSWKLALAAALFVGVTTAFLKFLSAGPLHHCGEVMSHKNAELSETMHESITGMKFIKMSTGEDIMKARYNKRLGEKIDAQTKLVKFQSISHPYLVTATGLFVCTLLFGFAYFEYGDGQWLSGFLMFLFLLMRLLSPVSQVNAARAQIFSNYFALDMLDKFFKETAQRKQPTGSMPFPRIKDGVEFNNVEFQYPQSDEKTICNLSMKIEAGQMVAIVGPSGSGKSTLVSLLTRFFDPQGGSIKIDGVDLQDIDVYDLRRHISVVSQDIFIFDDTVAENLKFAVEDITDEDVYRATRLAAADEFISAMPEGYETRLGDRGLRLSGGQQQRLAIARAILRNPDLLIFDEATSHLDTFTEQAIQDAVEVMRKERTILVIAHRLSTIQRADKVIVLKAGQIIEQGTHNALMSARGAYWEMVSQQNLDLVEDENLDQASVSDMSAGRQ